MPIILGADGLIQINFFLSENTTVSHFIKCTIYFFTKSTFIFLCLVVKAGTVFLLRCTIFGDSWRSWRSFLGVMAIDHSKKWSSTSYWIVILNRHTESSMIMIVNFILKFLQIFWPWLSFRSFLKKPTSSCIWNFRWTTWTFPSALLFRVLKIISHNCSGPQQFYYNETNSFTFQFIIFTNPSPRAGYDTKSIFKRSLTGLNSEFSFS